MSKNLIKTMSEWGLVKDQKIEESFSDVFNLFLFKKVLRINQAVHLITKHIDSLEPLRMRARETSIVVLEMSFKINNAENNEVKKTFLRNIKDKNIQLMSFIETAFVSLLIGESNYLLIMSELRSLSDIVSDKIKDKDGMTTLTPSFFDVGSSDERMSRGGLLKDKSVKDINIKDNYENNVLSTNKKTENNGQIVDENMDIVASSEVKKKYGEGVYSRKRIIRMSDKNERELKIMSFFFGGKKMSVKSISVLLPGVGEKTVQRELTRLVSVGKLKKEGEKRWTLYFDPNA